MLDSSPRETCPEFLSLVANIHLVMLSNVFFPDLIGTAYCLQMTVRDALNSALDEEMSADPKVFIMGEEVFEKLDEKYFTN